MLTDKEIGVLIDECRHQCAEEPEDFIGMTLAYLEAKAWVNGKLYSLRDLPSAMTRWNALILHTGKDASTYRTSFVAKYGLRVMGANPIDIPDRMAQFCQRFIGRWYPSADAMYYEFQLIHPFADGNGRVGLILWNLYGYDETGRWFTAEGLRPPDMFKERL